MQRSTTIGRTRCSPHTGARLCTAAPSVTPANQVDACSVGRKTCKKEAVGHSFARLLRACDLQRSDRMTHPLCFLDHGNRCHSPIVAFVTFRASSWRFLLAFRLRVTPEPNTAARGATHQPFLVSCFPYSKTRSPRFNKEGRKAARSGNRVMGAKHLLLSHRLLPRDLRITKKPVKTGRSANGADRNRTWLGGVPDLRQSRHLPCCWQRVPASPVGSRSSR